MSYEPASPRRAFGPPRTLRRVCRGAAGVAFGDVSAAHARSGSVYASTIDLHGSAEVLTGAARSVEADGAARQRDRGTRAEVQRAIARATGSGTHGEGRVCVHTLPIPQPSGVRG